MKTKKKAKLISLMISIMLSLSMLSFSAYAQGESVNGPADTAQTQIEQQKEQQVPELLQDTARDEEARTDSRIESEKSIQENDDADTSIPENEDPDINSDAYSEDQIDSNNLQLETKTDENNNDVEPSSEVEVTASSATNNIVGGVLANMVNSYGDEDNEAKKQASLKEYPLEHHELEYYGDSLRVRLVEGGDSEGSNYLVYRDSYLLISEKESSNYTVSYSEDGTEAYISPAISASELEGKTGIVFLADDVGNDNILVFDGEPVYDEDGMTVPILTADEVTINQLFSDGKLSMEQEYSQPQNVRGNKMLKSSGVNTPFVGFNTKVSGKNWTAEIDSFAVKDLDFDSHIDLFDLEASMTISMATEMGFKLEAKGDTEGRSTAKIASITVPVKYVDFTVSYSMQFECNGPHKLYMEGKMNNTIGFTLSTSRGREISQFSTPIRLQKFENRNQDKTIPVEFYIGSQFQWQGGALSVTIPVIDVEIGPVISINLTNTGGSRFTVKQEKDLYNKGQKTGNEIHTCAIHGEPGCLDFDVIDLENHRFFFRIDLYFWDKDFDFNDRLPKIVREYKMYESLTYDSGIMDGVCPHRFCRVPVAVWSNPDKTMAVAGMNVSAAGTVRHTPEEEYLISDVTGSDGKAVVYLPYFDKQRYTIVASGKLEGKTFAGSAQMPHYIMRDGNAQVDICVGSDEKVTIKTNLIWNTDVEKKEVPNQNFGAAILRREAGSDKDWEGAQNIVALKDREWQIEDVELGKFGAEGSRVFLYEYCVMPTIPANGRVLNPNRDPYSLFVGYGVHAYVDAVGRLESGHDTNFYIQSDTKTSGNTIEATITATPGIEIHVNKKWKLSKEGSKAVPIYLAVLRRPEEGWEDKAEEKKTANDWLPVTDPLAEGTSICTSSTTLEQLQNASVVSIAGDISSISNNRLAINEVSGGNSWRLRYIVPKYHNGIKMQFRGGEIDSSLIEKLLAYEYDLDLDADVKSFGDFVSKSYDLTNVNATTFDADVVNMDPVDEGTLRGTVRWEYANSNWDDIPETVELTISKNGEPISANPVILKKSGRSKGDDVWVWTVDLDDYDPEAKYTVEEKTDKGRLNKVWVPEHDGLDVYNKHIDLETVMVEARVSFEGDPGISELTATVKDGSKTMNSLILKKDKGWFEWDNLGGTNGNITIDNVKDISKYEFKVPDIDGYDIIYDNPVVTGDGISIGNLTYSYSARYMKKNRDLEIQIDKEILSNGDSNVPYDSYPNEVTVNLYRDGVWIKDITMRKPQGSPDKWPEITIKTDNNGNPLQRMDGNGHKYVYTFSEERVDGFTSEIKLLEDQGNTLQYRIFNEWVGSDHVHIKGKIDWKGDGGKTHLRPDSVRLSVINSKGEHVRSIDVPVNDNGTYESKYLPEKDSDGNPLEYSVLQSKAPGYTSTYSKPAYDGDTRTWTCDVTNTLTGYFPMTIKKKIEGVGPKDKETYRFRVEPLIEGVPDGKVAPEFDDEKSVYYIEGEGTAEVEFLLDKDGLYYYRFYEEKGDDPSCTYDTEERIILISRSTQKNGDDSKAEFKSWIVDKADVPSSEKGSMEKLTNNTVLFTNKYPGITIEKKWDIDLEGKDRPESIQAVLQKKSGNKWDDVQVVELNEENGWKTAVAKPDENAEYRVRELREEGTIEYLTNKIVYDKGDSDKGSATPNEVIYSVDEYTSVISGTEAAHKTEYQVSYKQDGDKYTITNKAILKIDTIKRWLSNDENKIPDSVWLVLLCSPKAGALDKAASIASTLGLDISSVLDYEFPVINPISGGINPVDLLSQLTIGVDLSIFSKALPTLSIGKATKDGNWKHEFVVSKYNMGIPMEYKGAELGSEIIRQVIKYVAKVNLPVSYNPIQNFFSIPTKAIRTFLGIEDPEQLLDFSGLTEKLLEKAKSLTIKDIEQFGPETPLDDWHLMANVINLLIDWDTDDDDDDDDDDPETKTIKGSKTWVDDNEADRPEYLKIHIKDGANEIEGSPVTLNKSDFEGQNKWTWSIKVDADKYKYATFVVSEEYPDNYEYKNYYSCENDGLDLTNSWHNTEVKTLNIQGQKIWKDENNRDGLRPEKLKVYLLADGERVKDSDGDDLSVETNEAAGWRYFFPNQPKFNEDGEEINYSVEEDPVEGYTSVVDGYNVINSHTPDKIQIRAQASWNDKENQDGIRPKTTVIRLFADGKDTGREFTLAEANNWTATFEDLYVNEAGKKINYTVKQDETDVITGVDGDGTYSFETTGDASEGFTITNKHTPLEKDIKFEKIWDDDKNRDGKRPNMITVKLMADREVVESQIVTAANGWKHTFADMPVYKDGNRIDYTLSEDNVDEYAKSISGNADKGFIITNMHTPDKIEFDVIKIWDDDNNRDGKRPQSVTVELLRFDEEADEYIPAGKSVVLSGQNKWRAGFSNLNKYENGKEIKYMVRETENIPGYEFTMMGTMEENFVLFGIHEPERRKIEGSKVWEDADNQDNARPESITIRLRADGRVVDNKIVTASDDWKWEFNDVYRYENGHEIKYSISEDVIDEYTSSISGNADEGFVVTNVHKPYKTQVNVYKVWDDTGDIEGFRPSSVKVDLYADGEKTDKSLILNEDNDFSGSFVDLDKNKAGEEIQYTVREEMTDIVTGSDGAGTYAVVITGDRYEGYTITNIHTSHFMEIPVDVEWDDGDNRDGIRPEYVSVRLLYDGEEQYGMAFIRVDNDWEGVTFINVPEYLEGKKLEFSASEDEIEGYEIRLSGNAKSGFRFTNVHVPETTSVDVSKVWDDADDRNGIRPESVTVKLLADGEDTGKTLELSEENKWTGSFEDLYKNSAARK